MRDVEGTIIFEQTLPQVRRSFKLIIEQHDLYLSFFANKINCHRNNYKRPVRVHSLDVLTKCSHICYSYNRVI